MIYKNISEEISNKKKKINEKIMGVLGKKSKNTFKKLAVYKIFREIIVDKNKNPILTKKIINEFIVKSLIYHSKVTSVTFLPCLKQKYGL